MSQVWIKVVNLSIQASWLVLVIILFRLAAAKAPKWSRVLLWGLVGIRLVCPVTLESMLSLVPSAKTISPDIMTQTDPSVETGIPAVNSTVNPLINYSFSPNPGDSVNPLQILIPLLSVIWLAGIGLLIIYTIVSYARLRYRLATAVHLRDNIWQSEWVTSPFVFGLVHPKIYLPFTLDEQTQQAVIAHEQAHLQRKDHWWKPLGFVILSVYWFNPLLWIGYLLFCRDIELACDEKAVREMDASQRADYSQALLDCTAHRHKVSVCPLAFGEVGIRQRVKAVLRYKKPTTWMVAGVLAICCIIAAAFLTSRPVDAAQQTSESFTEQLYSSITLQDNEILFTIPSELPKDAEFDLHIAGRAEYEDGFSQSLHFLEEQQGQWQANQTYKIPYDSSYTDLTLDLFFEYSDGKTQNETIDLLAVINEASDSLETDAAVELNEATGKACIAEILGTLTLHQDNTVSFSIPEHIPVSTDGKTKLMISLSATYSGETATVDSMLESQTGWKNGETYRGSLKSERGELLSVWLRVCFAAYEDENTYIEYLSGYNELTPPFVYDTPAGYTEPSVAVGQQGREASILYTMRDGYITQLSFTLPEGVTITEYENAEPYQLFFLKDEEIIGGISLHKFGTIDSEELSYVDTGADQLPMQIFSEVALSNHAGYENYQVRKHSDTGATATAKYYWQDLSQTDEYGSAAAIPYQQINCILTYDWNVMPYFVEMIFTEEAVPETELASLAKDIRLTAAG